MSNPTTPETLAQVLTTDQLNRIEGAARAMATAAERQKVLSGSWTCSDCGSTASMTEPYCPCKLETHDDRD